MPVWQCVSMTPAGANLLTTKICTYIIVSDEHVYPACMRVWHPVMPGYLTKLSAYIHNAYTYIHTYIHIHTYILLSQMSTCTLQACGSGTLQCQASKLPAYIHTWIYIHANIYTHTHFTVSDEHICPASMRVWHPAMPGYLAKLSASFTRFFPLRQFLCSKPTANFSCVNADMSLCCSVYAYDISLCCRVNESYEYASIYAYSYTYLYLLRG
jgi:hypothetical protein